MQHTSEALLLTSSSSSEPSTRWIKSAILDTKGMHDWHCCELGKKLTKAAFTGDLKIEAKVRWKQEGGAGFFLYADKNSLGEPVWISSKHFEKNAFHKIRIETQDKGLFVYVNDRLYQAGCLFIPKLGSQIGLMLDDSELELEDLFVYRSELRELDPLSLGHFLLAEKQYKKAFLRYQEAVAAVGPWAHFYSGLSLLEKLKKRHTKKAISECLKEFDKLKVDAAPLAYLGYALTYKEQGHQCEEVAILEEAFKHYSGHALMAHLKNYLMSRVVRVNNFAYFLLAKRYIPASEMSTEAQEVLHSLH